ncbi:MAG: MFS transporter [Anaerolineae bacterium]|nr:MFS transporter [Anaerolineae bacterium]
MTAEIRSVSYRELISGNKNFRNLWLGQIISLMGDWFNLIATAILTANLTGSGLAVGGLFVIRSLAQFVSSPFGGVLADRFNRKKILIWSDILRFFIVLGFLLVKDASQIWLLYTLTALQLGISGIFFRPRMQFFLMWSQKMRLVQPTRSLQRHGQRCWL